MPYTYPASGTIIYSKVPAINSRDLELQSQDPRVVNYTGNSISLRTVGGKIAFFYTDGDDPDQEYIDVYAAFFGGRLKADEINQIQWTLTNYKYTAVNSSYPALDRSDNNKDRIHYISVHADRFINHGLPVTISCSLVWQGVTYTTATIFQLTKVYRQPSIRLDRTTDLISFDLDASTNNFKYSQTSFNPNSPGDSNYIVVKPVNLTAGDSEYIVNINANYVRLFHGLNGSNELAISCGNFSPNSQYKITNLGNTTNQQWNIIAGTVGVTYSVGSTFTATVTGTGLGTGQAKPLEGTPKQISQSATSNDPNFIEYGPHYETETYVPGQNGLYLSVDKISGKILLRSGKNGWTSSSETFTVTAKRHGVTYETKYQIAKLTQQGIVDSTPPPMPGWTSDPQNSTLVITATAGTNTILVSINKTEFSYTSDYPQFQTDGITLRRDPGILAGVNPSTSRHAAVIVYGAKLSNPGESASITSYIDANGLVTSTNTGKQISDNILGQFGEKPTFGSGPLQDNYTGILGQSVFSLPAEPGSTYILFFAYVSKGGIVGPITTVSTRLTMGEDVQKIVDALTDSITEAQLYKGLQQRLSEIDRGDKRIASKVTLLDDQYSVKIDNAGHLAGFGLSNTNNIIEYDENGKETGTLSNGTPYSEFGVVADRFWITSPSYTSSTEPTDKWNGRVWVNPSITGLNQGLVGGVSVYYNVYKPNIHNEVTLPDDSDLHYWRVTTKTEIDKLINIVGGITYTNRGDWNVSSSYSVNDYINDQQNGIYYICIKSYTPVLLTNLATTVPGKLGYFTASGAALTVNKTVYISGAETIVTTENGGGSDSTYKLGTSYNSLGTFYYITQVDGINFQLSLQKSGSPITTGIKNNKKYWDSATSTWVSIPNSSMFPFIVTTTGANKGVYINAAYIQKASIGDAQIKDASITSAKIQSITASKIKGGKITADLIQTGALTINNIDIASLRDNANTVWVLAAPADTNQLLERTIELGPGSYEIVLYSSFYRDEEPGYYNTLQATITADVQNVSGSEITATAVWSKKQTVKADFSVTPTSGPAPLTITYADTSTGGPTSWTWAASDGASTSGISGGTYTFTQPGVYNITLTASRSTSDNTYIASSDTITKYGVVTVTSGDISVENTADTLGSITYDTATKKITYSGPTAAQIRALFSASGSLSYNSTTGVFSYTPPAGDGGGGGGDG